jgi:hypothetical protein
MRCTQSNSSLYTYDMVELRYLCMYVCVYVNIFIYLLDTGAPKGLVHTTGGYLTHAGVTTRNTFDAQEVRTVSTLVIITTNTTVSVLVLATTSAEYSSAFDCTKINLFMYTCNSIANFRCANNRYAILKLLFNV